MKTAKKLISALICAAVTVICLAVSVSAAEPVYAPAFNSADELKAIQGLAGAFGTVTVEGGKATVTAWKDASHTAATYCMTEPFTTPDPNMTTYTVDFTFTPLDDGWITAKAVIGASGTSEQGALLLQIYGNSNFMEKRGELVFNDGGNVISLGEFNTGELWADQAYTVRIFKDNTGNVELYFFEADGKVPAQPTLSVNSPNAAGLRSSFAFTGYAGEYTLEDLKIYGEKLPAPVAKAPSTTSSSTPAASSQTQSAASSKTDSAQDTSSDTSSVVSQTSETGNGVVSQGSTGGINPIVIVLLCVAGLALIGVAVLVVIMLKKDKAPAPQGGENANTDNKN